MNKSSVIQYFKHSSLCCIFFCELIATFFYAKIMKYRQTLQPFNEKSHFHIVLQAIGDISILNYINTGVTS